MDHINNTYHIIQGYQPVDLSGGPFSGDIISMKGYGHCDVLISIGAAAGTCVVSMDKSAAVAAATVELPFTRYYASGFRIDITGASGRFAEDSGFTAGDTITGGTSGATAVVHRDMGDHLLCHTWSGTAFTLAETITGTSLVTATTASLRKNEDMMLPRRTASATTYTFTIPAVANQKYLIPFDDGELGEGYDCLQVELADATAATVGEALYILTEPKYMGTPPLTAIYD
jgi:hypothetical protein